MTGQTQVRDVMVEMTQAIRSSQTLVAARQRMQGDMRVKSLIVVDENDRPIGAVRYNDISAAEAGGTVGEVTVAGIPTLTPDQTLQEVSGLMTEYDVDRLAVVDSSGAIVGELTRSALSRTETAGSSAAQTHETLSDADAGIQTPVYQVHQGMSVVGSAGASIGKVKNILSDAITGSLTHIVIDTGLIFSHEHSVPADLIGSVDGDTVHLKVEKGDIEALPDPSAGA
jgi:CBS domain-containing protein